MLTVESYLSLRSNGLEGNCGPVHPSELDAEIEIAFVDLPK